MKEQTTETRGESRPVWEGLEAFARQGGRTCCSRWHRGTARHSSSQAEGRRFHSGRQ
jgi:hypothetical protein